MLSFKTYLKKQEFSGRSLYNHFLNITIFFVWAKGEEDTLGLNENDWPEKPERDPEAYSEEEIKKMLETAAGTFRAIERGNGEKKDDRLLINAFLNSGLRDGELSHLTYGDIMRSILYGRSVQGPARLEDQRLETQRAGRGVADGQGDGAEEDRQQAGCRPDLSQRTRRGRHALNPDHSAHRQVGRGKGPRRQSQVSGDSHHVLAPGW